MSDRTQTATQTAAGLRRFSEQVTKHPTLVGFDGFVDSIISVVDKRHSIESFDAIDTIERFGQKIVNAAGQSSNYELVVNLEKLGGNGPIMANALASLGLPLTYIGALGYPSLHPVFESFSQHATVLSIAEPGFTDALEFRDGKLMLGKHGSLSGVNMERISKVIGTERFARIVENAHLIGMVNWTMLVRQQEIWEHMIEHVLPNLDKGLAIGDTKPTGRRRIFVDLADPEKRTDADLRQAMTLCTRMNAYCDVTLGLNLKESMQVASVLDLSVGDTPQEVEPRIEELAGKLREALSLNCVAIHPRAAAAAAWQSADGGVDSARFLGPYVKEPRISTGAGDHFNAGLCVGQLAGLSIEQCLCAGVATSGYYVRNAASPSLEELAGFCDQLPDPE